MVAGAPVPTAGEDSLPFWRAAARGELRVQRCARCAVLRWPPAPVCPACWAPDAAWERLDGRGTLRAWVVYPAGARPGVGEPYAVGLAELTEGPRFTARLAVEAARLRDGLPVRVAFRARHGAQLADGTALALPVLVAAEHDDHHDDSAAAA